MIRLFNRYISAKSVTLAAFEAGLIALALFSAVGIRFWANSDEFQSYIALPDFGLQLAVFVATFQMCFYYCDLYNLSAMHARSEQVIALGQSLGSGCLLLGIVYFLFPSLLLGRGIFFISIILVPAFIVTSRTAMDRVWRAAAPENRILVMGTDHLAVSVATEIANRDDLGWRLIGFVEGKATSGRGGTVAGCPVFDAADLQSAVERNQISTIIVALEDRRNNLPVQQLVRLRVQGIRVEDVHSTVAALTGRVWLETVKPSWFVFSNGFRRSAATLMLKRALDLASGVVGLILSSPIMLAVAVAIRLHSNGPIIYRQTRVGYRGKHFALLKFRSMAVDAEAKGGAQWASANDPRVTRVGRVLRKYRLDELPQFINVIRGDMSLVGPRPERPAFVESLRERISYYDERHTVRPGLTGWAQVRYQYGSNVEDAVRKMEYDLFYLKNMSMPFDCAIIVDTIRIVLTGRGGQ